MADRCNISDFTMLTFEAFGIGYSWRKFKGNKGPIGHI